MTKDKGLRIGDGEKASAGSSPRSRGQATTEVVLLFPVFLIVLMMVSKAFAVLVLIQKMEIASFYAARRWQLESHRNAIYADSFDKNYLEYDIRKKVEDYIGFNNASTRNFLNIDTVELKVERTQVWNILTLTVNPKPMGGIVCRYKKEEVCGAPYGEPCMRGHDYLCGGGRPMTVVKYVPNRDRPIKVQLPGLRE